MIPATHKRLRSIFLTFLLVATLGVGILCQPPHMVGIVGATSVTGSTSIANVGNAADVSDIINTVISLLKCYVGSCGMESQNQ